MFEIQHLASSVVGSVRSGRNLTSSLGGIWQRNPQLNSQQRGAVADISYGVLRFGGQLEAILKQLVPKGLDDKCLHWLLLVALYQLLYTRSAPHAIVDHAVRCVAAMDLGRARGLVNAVLRNFLRRREILLTAAGQKEEGKYSHPQWWIDKLRKQYPGEYQLIMGAGNQRPLFTLRVNRRRCSRDDYLGQLASMGIEACPAGNDGVILRHAMPLATLPGFLNGTVSVQDAGAQYAARLLDIRDGMRVLDACAAPGGKTTHLLELADISLLALDSDMQRLERIRENLSRLKLAAQVKQGDAREPTAWWDGQPFDRILLDAPCSASGVARRHPDIKWLRRASDLSRFSEQQCELMDALWPLLAKDGKLLYTTCSIFQEENSRQVAAFTARRADAVPLPMRETELHDGGIKGQLLPDHEHDGFYYALLQKS